MIKDNHIKAGVIGHPIDHSLSPRLHQYWLNNYEINGSYEAFDIHPDELKEFIKNLSVNGFIGINVTVPFKEKVAKLVDVLDENASRLGAVNTIVVGPDGLLYGSNTDGFGFMENLISNFPQWRPEIGPAVILGAGGAAKSVAASLVDCNVSEIRLTNRTHKKTQSLIKKIGGSIKACKWENRSNLLKDATLLVNTTTLGMTGKPPLDINLEFLPVNAVVIDIVYSPLMTPLLQQAKDRSNPIINGIGMLLHQARPGFKQWFGNDPEVTKKLENHILLGV
jgi:shikimate dehydrogenase